MLEIRASDNPTMGHNVIEVKINNMWYLLCQVGTGVSFGGGPVFSQCEEPYRAAGDEAFRLFLAAPILLKLVNDAHRIATAELPDYSRASLIKCWAEDMGEVMETLALKSAKVVAPYLVLLCPCAKVEEEYGRIGPTNQHCCFSCRLAGEHIAACSKCEAYADEDDEV